VLLVQPDTRRTGDPFENQRRLALAAVRPLAADAHETLLEIGMIIKLQALDDRRHGLARGIRQGITIAVVIAQAVVYNRLRHRLTAATTHAARLPVDIYREIHSGRHGLSAVVTVGQTHHRRTPARRHAPSSFGWAARFTVTGVSSTLRQPGAG
jgi:hypothetical protein